MLYVNIKGERRRMKRIISALTAAIMALCTVSVFAASNSKVEIKNDSDTVKYEYSSDMSDETVTDINKLFKKVGNLNENVSEVVQNFTVTSSISSGGAISFGLRISGDEAALTYFNVKVEDSNGNILSETAASSEGIETDKDNNSVKNLDLGVFNNQFTKETKNYKISVSVPDGTTAEQRAAIRDEINWSAVSVPVKDDTVSDSVPTATPVPATTAPTVSPAAQTPSATAAPAAEKDTKGIKYVGKNKDIVPGKYTITGNGTVKLYDSKDTLKKNIKLTDGSSSSVDGIESYVLDLAEGDRIEISDKINLKPYSEASASPKATASPKAKAKAATPKPTSAAKTTDKTNPKTGDVAPVAAVAGLAIAALGVYMYIEYTKRKKN